MPHGVALCFCIQIHALDTVSARLRLEVHPSTLRALAGSATRTGGRPAAAVRSFAGPVSPVAADWCRI
jgi:hypothetical protein